MSRGLGVQALGERGARWATRLIPDPFVLVVILTLGTFAAGFVWGEQVSALPALGRAHALGQGWFKSLYSTGLMAFAMQMCIVLVTGHALALAPPVQRLIAAVCRFAVSARSAVVIVVCVSALASLVQWGLGVIVGALMAREMGKRLKHEGVRVHYPLLGAAGYSGFMVWHGGLSGSAPLKVAEEGHFLEDAIGVIPISETIFSAMNLCVTGATLACLVALFWLMMPTDPDAMSEYPGDDGAEGAMQDEQLKGGVLGWLEDRAWLSRAMSVAMMGWVVSMIAGQGVAAVNLNTINLTFLALGLMGHPGVRSYVSAVQDGVKGCAGVILQFPFYFGILGVLKSSGLIVQLSTWMVSVSSPESFGALTFLSAGLVNFLVPSGGGQWAVQGPLMVEGAKAMGLEMPRVIMAMSYGDAWTNLLQPFWALPLLGIMRLQARDILGYTGLVMCVTGPVIMALLVWL